MSAAPMMGRSERRIVRKLKYRVRRRVLRKKKDDGCDQHLAHGFSGPKFGLYGIVLPSGFVMSL